MPSSVKTLEGGKCFWAYSVWRDKTIKDSLHQYTIHVSVSQVDSLGKPRGTVRIHGANIRCVWREKGILKRVRFVSKKNYWTSTFTIYTNRALPVDIVASYNGVTRTMSLTLNDHTYPGESDEPVKEAL